MRIGGIASGMDTEQMVRDLMKAERTRVNKFLRQEQSFKWRQDAYTGVNRVMANFILNTRRDLGLNQVSTTGTLRPNATSSLNWVKTATSSNEAVVTATARGNAMNGNHTILVEKLASNGVLSSQKLTIANDTDKQEIPVLDAEFNFRVDGKISVETHLGSTIIEIKAGENINTFISNINNAIDQVDPDKKISLGLRAAFDRDLGRVMINTRGTGDTAFVKISDSEGTNAEKMFGLYDLAPGMKIAEAKGNDAELYFNETFVKKSTNNFTIYGIELNLKSAAPGTVNINVDTNVDGIFNKIKSFVDSYNEMLDNLTGKLNEKQHRSFTPLTKEEKEAMKDKEIELWEEKARSGLLRNDEALTRTLQKLRSDIFKSVKGVSGTFKHLTELGISTGNFRDGGKLVIDEAKLRNAIGNDPEGVMDLFFKAPSAEATGEKRTEESGFIQRIYDGLTTGIKEVVRRAGTGNDASLLRNVQSNILIDFLTKHSSISGLDRELQGLNTRIAREEDILRAREDRYWRQFSAMEKALAKMQQQSTWLMSQMGFGQ